MPLRLEIKKEMTSRSDRVKSVDIYPADQSWLLSAMYNGNCVIYDYSTNVRHAVVSAGSPCPALAPHPPHTMCLRRPPYPTPRHRPW